jgi:galactitol-specific phosphotransferase system IIC component
LAACVTMIALNAGRLYLVSLDYDSYDYWHNKFGAEIFAMASTFIIATICAWGASIEAQGCSVLNKALMMWTASPQRHHSAKAWSPERHKEGDRP